MNAPSVVLFFLAAVLLLLMFRKESDVLSPAKGFGFIWLCALGLTNLKLSAFQSEWSFTNWAQVLIGPAAFLTGVLASHVAYVRTTILSVHEIRRSWSAGGISPDRLFVAVCILFAFYAVGYAVIYAVKGFLPILSLAGAAHRGDFSMFGLGVSLATMPAVVLFAVVSFIMSTGRPLRKFVLIVILGVSLSTFILLLQRFQIFMACIMTATVLYYATRHVRLRTVIVALVMTVTLFYGVSRLRAGDLVTQIIYSSSKMKMSRDYAIFTEPYMYVVMNLENLARATDQVESYTFGLYTFDFLTALTGLKHWVREYMALDDTPFLVSVYNTYTAFWTYYRDFGLAGILVIPLGGGFGVGTLYYQMRKRPTIENISWYALFVFVMFISFFNSPMSLLFFVWVVLVMAVVFRMIRTSSRHHTPPPQV